MICAPLCDAISTLEYALPPPKSYSPFGLVPKYVVSRFNRTSRSKTKCVPRSGVRKTLPQGKEVVECGNHRAARDIEGLKQTVVELHCRIGMVRCYKRRRGPRDAKHRVQSQPLRRIAREVKCQVALPVDIRNSETRVEHCLIRIGGWPGQVVKGYASKEMIRALLVVHANGELIGICRHLR